MFGMFGDAKIKAACLGDTLGPLQNYCDVNLNDLGGKENYDLQEAAFLVLNDTVGKQKKYHSFEMVCATWMALIKLSKTSRSHSFAELVERLERGFEGYLTDHVDITTRNGMPRGLFAAIEKYL